jgi:hypothetical protein
LRVVELPDEDDAELDRREVEEPEPDRELVLARRLLDALDGLRALEPELRDPDPLRELADPEPLRAVDDLRALDAELRALEPEPLRALDFRAPEPELDPRDVDFEPLRDEPPPLPPVDSAISFPPQEAPCPRTPRAAPHYLMPSAVVTYA